MERFFDLFLMFVSVFCFSVFCDTNVFWVFWLQHYGTLFHPLEKVDSLSCVLPLCKSLC